MADTVEVNGSGSRVEQGNEDMRMNRKMSFFASTDSSQLSPSLGLCFFQDAAMAGDAEEVRGSVMETSDLFNFPFSSVG